MHPRRLLTAVVSVTSLLIIWFLIAVILEERNVYVTIARDKENMVKQFATCRGPSTMIQAHKSPKMCSPGFLWQQGRCAQCPRGTFSLPQWTVCEDFLTCDDLT